jgi:hypothetical protein
MQRTSRSDEGKTLKNLILLRRPATSLASTASTTTTTSSTSTTNEQARCSCYQCHTCDCAESVCDDANNVRKLPTQRTKMVVNKSINCKLIDTLPKKPNQKNVSIQINRNENNNTNRNNIVNANKPIKKSLACQTEEFGGLAKVEQIKEPIIKTVKGTNQFSLAKIMKKNILLTMLMIIKFMLTILLFFTQLALKLTIKIKYLLFFPLFLLRYLLFILIMPFSTNLAQSVNSNWCLFPFLLIITTTYLASLVNFKQFINFFTNKFTPNDDLSLLLAKIKGIL